MSDIAHLISRDIDDDVTLKPHGLIVDLDRKGFLVKQKVLHVGGAVGSKRERDRIRAIVDHHAGDAYRVEFSVAVREHAQA